MTSQRFKSGRKFGWHSGKVVAKELEVISTTATTEIWGPVHLATVTRISGTVTLPGNLTVEGNFTFGNAQTDALTCTGKVDMNAGVEFSVSGTVTAATAYTTSATTTIILVDNKSATAVVTLATTQMAAGRMVIVKDAAGVADVKKSIHIVTADKTNYKIDGKGTCTIATTYGGVVLLSDGSNFWHKIADFGQTSAACATE